MVTTSTKSLIWWHSISENEKQRLAEKHYKEEVETLGLMYVHRSNSRIEFIYKKENIS
jgi:hypothetical protein